MRPPGASKSACGFYAPSRFGLLEERQELFREFYVIPMETGDWSCLFTIGEALTCLAITVANSFGFCGSPVCERRRRVSCSLSPDVVFLIYTQLLHYVVAVLMFVVV